MGGMNRMSPSRPRAGCEQIPCLLQCPRKIKVCVCVLFVCFVVVVVVVLGVFVHSLFTYLSACLLACLPACLSACLPACLPVCLIYNVVSLFTFSSFVWLFLHFGLLSITFHLRKLSWQFLFSWKGQACFCFSYHFSLWLVLTELYSPRSCSVWHFDRHQRHFLFCTPGQLTGL